MVVAYLISVQCVNKKKIYKYRCWYWLVLVMILMIQGLISFSHRHKNYATKEVSKRMKEKSIAITETFFFFLLALLECIERSLVGAQQFPFDTRHRIWPQSFNNLFVKVVFQLLDARKNRKKAAESKLEQVDIGDTHTHTHNYQTP